MTATRSLRALVGAALLLLSSAVMAQAAARRHYVVHISRQALDSAVKEFARQTGLQVARFADGVEGQSLVGPVDGELSIQQALDLLLAHSSLSYKLINDHTIAIVGSKPVETNPPRGHHQRTPGGGA